ncbi:MAG: Trypsin-like peptidase domain [Candidatus Parcubacteria bacterium]|jgi:hypothetical protein
MPILIRIIAQRLVVFIFTILAFFGINPDLSAPPQEVVEERKIEQQNTVENILSIPEENKQEQESKPEVVKNVEQKITEIQKEFTQTIAQPIIETAKDVTPTSLVFEDTQKSFDVRDVVVNIICIEKTSSFTRLSTGSGVVISPSGLILTNAHVTYPFLKSPQFGTNTYSCSVRRENIPNFGYNAELVYYPSDWLNENKDIIKDPSPVGTGENDYSLLQITSGIGPTKVGTFSFASTAVTTNNLKKGLDITAAGYPSSNSGVFEIDTKPGLKIAQTQIVDFFTFNTQSFDVLQTGVNNVAHRGSSGGGIFNENNLYGIVVTTNSNSNGSYINALTLPYIKKDFEADTGLNFDSFIKYPISSLENTFNSKFKEKVSKIISEN